MRNNKDQALLVNQPFKKNLLINTKSKWPNVNKKKKEKEIPMPKKYAIGKLKINAKT